MATAAPGGFTGTLVPDIYSPGSNNAVGSTGTLIPEVYDGVGNAGGNNGSTTLTKPVVEEVMYEAMETSAVPSSEDQNQVQADNGVLYTSTGTVDQPAPPNSDDVYAAPVKKNLRGRANSVSNCVPPTRPPAGLWPQPSFAHAVWMCVDVCVCVCVCVCVWWWWWWGGVVTLSCLAARRVPRQPAFVHALPIQVAADTCSYV